MPKMNNDYAELCERLENKEFDSMASRVDNKTMRLIHHTMGLVTEAGELMDTVKRYLIYGKPIDWVNLKEEAGDIAWYLVGLANTLDTTLEEIQQMNVNKLYARFPGKFDADAAINRDTDHEREILENRHPKKN